MKLEFVELATQRGYRLATREEEAELSWTLIEASTEVWRISFGQLGLTRAYMGSSVILATDRDIGRLIGVKSVKGEAFDVLGVLAYVVKYRSVGDITVKV